MPPSGSIVIVVRGPIAPAALAELCERVRVVVATRPSEPVVCDVGALGRRDERALEALARLQLTAQRMGASIELHNAPEELADLLDLLGLSDVLPVTVESVDRVDRVDSDRLVEEREQVRVDEEVDPGDAAG
jgi:ABC-type transporter Mla MlaB component